MIKKSVFSSFKEEEAHSLAVKFPDHKIVEETIQSNLKCQ